MFGLGSTELIVIGVIIFLIFGAKRLPEIGKGLGGALKEFRQIKKDINPEAESGTDGDGEENQAEKKLLSVENKVVGKMVEQIPGVKTAMDVKSKVDKVKEIIK